MFGRMDFKKVIKVGGYCYDLYASNIITFDMRIFEKSSVHNIYDTTIEITGNQYEQTSIIGL